MPSTKSTLGSQETHPAAPPTWIEWFTGLQENRFLCQVDKAFIEDSFNLFGLKAYAPEHFHRAVDVLLDRSDGQDDSPELFRCCELLYGLMHGRYVLSSGGLLDMHGKYLAGAFGVCPRVACASQGVLPIGLADEPGQAAVKVYCPACRDVYAPSPVLAAHLDGACFGTSFPHLFLLAFPDLVPRNTNSIGQQGISSNGKGQGQGGGKGVFVPRIYGFKVHSSSPLFHPCTPEEVQEEEEGDDQHHHHHQQQDQDQEEDYRHHNHHEGKGQSKRPRGR